MPARVSRVRCTTPCLLLALATTLSGQHDAVRFTAEVYPGEFSFLRGSERWLCYRIVEDLAGKPIAGAELFLVKESLTPIAGKFWFTRKATSDADGFVRIPVSDIDGEWHLQVLRAKGWAVSSRSGMGDPIWRIAPPQDVPVLVCDWRGMPVAGAMIGFCGSCGHGPDLVNATSDANGIAMLRGIDPHNDIADLYAQCEGLGLGYDSLRWSPGDPPFMFTCPYAAAITGRLLDHQGKPIAGAFVGAPDVHRGPWAETTADGSFTILGAPDGCPPIACVGNRRIEFPLPRTYPAVLRVPAPDGEPVCVGILDEPPGAPPQAIKTTSIEVRVADDSAGEDAVVWATFPGQRRPNDAKDGHIDVPDVGPFVLAVGQRRYPFAGLAALPPQPVVLRDYPPTIVTGKAIDAHGDAVAVRARWHQSDDDKAIAVEAKDGAFRLAARDTGLSLIELVPLRPDLRPRLLWVTLPHRGDTVRVDLGTFRLVAEPQLRVLDVDGRPFAAAVQLARAGLRPAGAPRTFALDAAGGWLGPDLRAGDAIVVSQVVDVQDLARIAVPFRTVLAGDGPWTLQPPVGVLALTVHDQSDATIEAQVLIADQVFDLKNAVELVGLPAGPLQFYVSAADLQTAIVTTTIPASGKQELQIRLPPL